MTREEIKARIEELYKQLDELDGDTSIPYDAYVSAEKLLDLFDEAIPAGVTEQEIDAARAFLKALVKEYKNPFVQEDRIHRQIAKLERELEELENNAA